MCCSIVRPARGATSALTNRSAVPRSHSLFLFRPSLRRAFQRRLRPTSSSTCASSNVRSKKWGESPSLTAYFVADQTADEPSNIASVKCSHNSSNYAPPRRDGRRRLRLVLSSPGLTTYFSFDQILMSLPQPLQLRKLQRPL
jgi:hypothetical protein